jgi:luciferase family oxidoreductase group 1
MIPYSVLDLSPIVEGSNAAVSLQNSLKLAQHTEQLGFERFWVAEHHSMPGIASAATSIVVGHIASGTQKIRVGAGGVMLPNHSPLVIAEQYGTLDSLYPNRIDLGVGRAPGSDGITAKALRRDFANQDRFPEDLAELQAYLSDYDPLQKHVRAIPGEGTNVPIWILGSSLYGAHLAAELGLPYVFASHFAPDALGQAAKVYRHKFKPSNVLDKPYFMFAVNVFAADSQAEADYLMSSHQRGFANLILGKPGLLPQPVENIEQHVDGLTLARVNSALSCTASGTLDKVRAQLAGLIDQYQPDEIMINGPIFDQEARLKSFSLASQAILTLNTQS